MGISQQLRKDELSFLKAQGLAPEDVYDGRSETSAVWKRRCREAGKTLVLGAPCRSAGHRLRTRSGHCAQCDTAKISYQRRFNTKGYVYVAVSKQGQLTKVGTAVDVQQRETNLVGHRYAGQTDWQIVFYVEVTTGGKIEHEVQRRLQRYALIREYEKDGRLQAAEEIFSCSYDKAVQVVVSVLQKQKTTDKWLHPNHKSFMFS